MRAIAEAAPGVDLALELPDGATPEAESTLPVFELGPLRGARVSHRAGWTGAFGLARVACATAPAAGFAPGVEDLVFGRATQIARGAIPAVVRLDPAPARATSTGFDQRLDGEATLEGAPAKLRARHLLAFTDGGANAVLCSVACVERSAGSCASTLDGAGLEGALSPPPAPGLVTRGVFLAIEHPFASMALGAAAFVVASAWIIARRPRAPH